VLTRAHLDPPSACDVDQSLRVFFLPALVPAVIPLALLLRPSGAQLNLRKQHHTGIRLCMDLRILSLVIVFLCGIVPIVGRAGSSSQVHASAHIRP